MSISVALLLTPDPDKRLSASNLFRLREEAKRKKKKMMLVINSKGRASKIKGGVLGQYEYLENKKYYAQTSTEQSHEKFRARYMYQDSDNGWWVGPTPGKKTGHLRNTHTNNESLPENGHWKYYDGKSWQDDVTVTVSRGPLQPLPRLFTVTASGAAVDKWPSFLGVFTRTQRWWYGRPIYTNTHGRLLYHGGGDFGWVIGDKLGYTALRGSRARDSPLTEVSWRYYSGTGYEPTSVTVTGSD